MHQVILTGNIGSKPKKYKFDNGKEIIEFSIAESIVEKDVKTTIWHDVKAWGALANLPLDSGSFVCIIGKIRYSQFNDKDGKKVTRSYILADKLFLIQKIEKDFFSENVNPFLT